MRRIFARLRLWHAQHRIQRQYEKLEAAVRREAELAGEVEVERKLTDWYTSRTKLIDPNTQWNEWAQVKEKEKNHYEDYVALKMRQEEAQAEIDARIPAPVLPTKECDCERCKPRDWNNIRMVLCPKCGNKRCPKAQWHGYKCTGSNEPGQVPEEE